MYFSRTCIHMTSLRKKHKPQVPISTESLPFLWLVKKKKPKYSMHLSKNNIYKNCFLECDEFHPCQGLGEHAHFRSFGMAFLTLFRIATGDNWNGIMKDTLREECEDGDDCLRNCCVSPYFAPLFFVVFVLMAQFVLVNVVVAVLMKHLEESHKQVRFFAKTSWVRIPFLY